MNREIIIAEANFIEQIIYDIYVGSKELTPLDWATLKRRLQTIRSEVRKDNG